MVYGNIWLPKAIQRRVYAHNGSRYNGITVHSNQRLLGITNFLGDVIQSNQVSC